MTDVTATERAAPWRGKRRVNDPRDRVVRVRCTDADLATISAAAAQSGMTISAFMRHQAIGTAGPRAVRRPQVDRVELARALGLIGLYGSNVNQLAREANTHGDLPTAAQLEALSQQVRDMRGALRRALGYGD